MELTGDRILLREFALSDVDALRAVHSDPRVLRYYAAEVGTREHAQSLVEMFIAWAIETPRQNFQLAIIEPGANRLVGSCGVRTKGCPPGEAEFGIGIASEWWGSGIAHEAARIVLEFGFSELAVKEIRGVAVSENEAVVKFARRLGFTASSPRRGDNWMTERGWNAVDWVLTRDAWEGDRDLP